jgi:HK97 family phage prohead protease
MKLEELVEAVVDCSSRAAQIHEMRKSAVVPEVRSISEEARTIEFVSSTEGVDRYGDIIRVKGWDTAAYMKNPVFLWGHQSSQPPIGKTISLKKETGARPALIQTVQFATKDEYPFADTVFNLYKGGYMKAVSVGFKPLEAPKLIKDTDTGEFTGYEFTKQELLELSAVPIPANPEAVARAIGDGVIRQGDVATFFINRESTLATPEETTIAMLKARIFLMRLVHIGLEAEIVARQFESMLERKSETGPVNEKTIESLEQLFETIGR